MRLGPSAKPEDFDGQDDIELANLDLHEGEKQEQSPAPWIEMSFQMMLSNATLTAISVNCWKPSSTTSQMDMQSNTRRNLRRCEWPQAHKEQHQQGVATLHPMEGWFHKLGETCRHQGAQSN
jgi:hypothetical protein